MGYPGIPVHFTPSQEMCQLSEAKDEEDLTGCGVTKAVTGVNFNPKAIFMHWIKDYNNYTNYDRNHTQMMLFNLKGGC